MEFGNLPAMYWGLLAIPIVVFYILKIRLRRVPVSTVMFWNQIFEEKRPRSIWQQLRHLVSLLLQLLLLALLVSALLDPSWTWERLQARRIVLVMDNSASMNAVSDSDSRLAQAKQEGRRLIRGLRLRDEMAIVSTGSVPRVVTGLTSHQRTLREALDGVPATDGPSQVDASVQLARRLLAEHENAQVVVLTDGCFDGAAELGEAEDLQLVRVGEELDNVGITQFQVRRSLSDPIGYQILVEVTNFSSQAVACRLEIDLGDELVDVIPLRLEPEERWSRVIDEASAEGGYLVAQLDRPDALEADNRAVAILPRRERQPVLLVTEGSLFLQRVFEAIPMVELTITDQLPETIPADTIVVYHRRTPPQLPAGPVLVIDPRDSTDLWDLGETLQNPLITDQDSQSPLMTHVQLDNVLMPEARQLTFHSEPQVLAGSIGGEPIYCAFDGDRRQPGQGKLLVLTVNLAKGDLPLRTAFPILMTNALTWLQGQQGELREAVATGSVVDVDLDELGFSGGSDLVLRRAAAVRRVENPSYESVEAESELVLRSPQGQVRSLPVGVRQTTIGPLDQCGVWRIERQQEEGREAEEWEQWVWEVACNLADSKESDLRPAALPEASHQASSLDSGLGGRPIWFYLIAAALLLTVVEWYLYQRRWVG